MSDETITYTPDGLIATNSGKSKLPENPNPSAAAGTPPAPGSGIAGSAATRYYDASGSLVGVVDGSGTTVTLGSVTAPATPGGVKRPLAPIPSLARPSPSEPLQPERSNCPSSSATASTPEKPSSSQPAAPPLPPPPPASPTRSASPADQPKPPQATPPTQQPPQRPTGTGQTRPTPTASEPRTATSQASSTPSAP
jgi:hypothetical protein